MAAKRLALPSLPIANSRHAPLSFLNFFEGNYGKFLIKDAYGGQTTDATVSVRGE